LTEGEGFWVFALAIAVMMSVMIGAS